MKTFYLRVHQEQCDDFKRTLDYRKPSAGRHRNTLHNRVTLVHHMNVWRLQTQGRIQFQFYTKHSHILKTRC